MLPTPPTSTPPPVHLLGVLRTLWRWRRSILITTAIGAVVSIVISLLLPVYFTGYTSFVAISPEQVSIESTFGTNGGRIQFYGTGDDIDRLLSIAESNEVVDYLIDTFNLYGVYNIDSTNRKGPVRVVEEFQRRFSVERNPRDIIELTVEDRDPERAAAMANAARERINEVNLRLIRATHGRNASGLQREADESQRRLDALNERLSELRQTSGVYNTEAQSEALATAASTLDRQIAGTQARLAAFREMSLRDSIAKLTVDLAGLRETRGAVTTQLEKLNASIGQIDNLEEERLQANEALSDSRTRLKQYQSILDGDRRTLEVIEEARTPLVKSSPIRWLIVVASTVLTFLCSVIGVLLLDSSRRYDWGSITR
ncbi:uncharacterized protein involved in exopolysaccharide biosynthesis [Lewinella marina]|uniref:Polysaccharide chain length determinant N-terminal domain-containing protein n=1 Tax=Neolewinella marina TaxID=438751 RepID=A0A2G0CH07_9BACT|nr:hypothetical protein [Neolewinella marina]NJB86272.1 uncharacterized protein involved in exopolysaccharide biosynthesis [Neolewinella marina]PHK99256.1 hypothetical protein CGL56_07305 [Neolewinella marina]